MAWVRADATMRSLSAADVLDLWQAGQSLSSPQRALAALMATHPAESSQALARLSIGQRDGRLLTLREQLFGEDITATADCPRCGERVELSFTTAETRAPEADGDAEIELHVDGHIARVRPVNSLDLIEVADCPDEATARLELLNRCVIDLRPDGGDQAIRPAQVPDEVAAAIAARMSEADPQADVQLALACPGCGFAWHAAFDIASFVWREIDAWAQRTLDEVHLLAGAYHWTERDILAMSAWRRQQYLQRLA